MSQYFHSIRIDADKCDGRMSCLNSCPKGAIQGEKKQVHSIDTQLCDKCGICVASCTREAIAVH